MPLRRLYLGDNAVLFAFLLSTLLIFSSKHFHGKGVGDGFIEYEVARRIVESGAVDLPQHRGWRDARIQEGRGGKYFSWYGFGQSLLFVPAVAADKFAIRAAGILPPSLKGRPFIEPFFISKSANAFVLAMTGVCLFSLLGDLGISRSVSSMTTVMYVFGSMALVYSTLSFDISLSVLLLLWGFLCLFRAVDRARPAYWLYAGLLLGFSVVTRVSAVIFFLPVAVFVLSPRSSSRPYVRARLRATALLLAGILPLALLFFWYNYHRFGSLFYLGYDRATSPFDFSASLLESAPALLFSPGRGLFVFSPVLALSVLGVPAFVRAGRIKAVAVLLAVLVNFLFFAKWSWWATPNAWGPRFQLPTVALMFIPLAYWLEGRWRRGSPAFRRLIVAAFAICVLLQLVPAVGGYSAAGTDSTSYWNWGDAQLPTAVGNLWAIAADGRWDAAWPWWAAPGAHGLPILILLVVIVAASLLSLLLLCRMLGRGPTSEGAA